MDGHRSHWMVDLEQANRLIAILVRASERYYQQISPPELLIMLRVDPEIAVQRKTDEDPASVRLRSSEM